MDIVILGLLSCLYIQMFNVFSFYYLFHDLIVNFLIPLYVNTGIYLVHSLSFINFSGLGFLT